MKLKKILSDIKERWVMGTESSVDNTEYREIFVNPTQSEINDIIEFGGYRVEDIRFVADNYGMNVYISSADVFHQSILDEVRELTIDEQFQYFMGQGRVENGIIEVANISDVYETAYEEFTKKRVLEVFNDVIEGNYDWMERYNFKLDYIKDMIEEEIEFIEDELSVE